MSRFLTVNMVNPLFINMMAKFLNDNGYIKLSRFLWCKNIKTEVATGNAILVNLVYSTITVAKIKDRFLFIKHAPKLELVPTKYNTITEFKRYIINNEKTQLEFLKKQKEWGKRK